MNIYWYRPNDPFDLLYDVLSLVTPFLFFCLSEMFVENVKSEKKILSEPLPPLIQDFWDLRDFRSWWRSRKKKCRSPPPPPPPAIRYWFAPMVLVHQRFQHPPDGAAAPRGLDVHSPSKLRADWWWWPQGSLRDSEWSLRSLQNEWITQMFTPNQWRHQGGAWGGKCPPS